MGWPNRLSILRLILLIPFVALMLIYGDDPRRPLRWTALIVFVATALTDFFDGYLARRLSAFSNLGRILDPLADKLLTLAALILLAWIGTVDETALPDANWWRLPWWFVAVAIGKDVAIACGFAWNRYVWNRPLLEVSWSSKWCTGVQMGTFALVLMAPDLPDGVQFLPRLAWWTAAILAVWTLADYIRTMMAAKPRSSDSES